MARHLDLCHPYPHGRAPVRDLALCEQSSGDGFMRQVPNPQIQSSCRDHSLSGDCLCGERKFFTPAPFASDAVGADEYLRCKLDLYECPREPKPAEAHACLVRPEPSATLR
jgi:hypothetical protein